MICCRFIDLDFKFKLACDQRGPTGFKSGNFPTKCVVWVHCVCFIVRLVFATVQQASR